MASALFEAEGVVLTDVTEYTDVELCETIVVATLVPLDVVLSETPIDMLTVCIVP